MRNTVRVAQSKIVTSELRANEIVVSCKEDSRHTIVAFQESLERDYKQKEKQLRATDSTQILAVAKMKQDIVTVNKLTGPTEIQNSAFYGVMAYRQVGKSNRLMAMFAANTAHSGRSAITARMYLKPEIPELIGPVLRSMKRSL